MIRASAVVERADRGPLAPGYCDMILERAVEMTFRPRAPSQGLFLRDPRFSCRRRTTSEQQRGREKARQHTV
jgi:hypothetical protein